MCKEEGGRSSGECLAGVMSGRGSLYSDRLLPCVPWSGLLGDDRLLSASLLLSSSNPSASEVLRTARKSLQTEMGLGKIISTEENVLVRIRVALESKSVVLS